jgi:PKD repeat protein
MPLEERFEKKIYADWSFKITDMTQRVVSFQDLSLGNINIWEWDFGDGNSSRERNPVHQYQQAGLYTVTLHISGPEGKSRMAKVWDVAIR